MVADVAVILQTRDLYTIQQGLHPDWPNGLDRNFRHWTYNGLDSAVTLKVHEGLSRTIAQSPTPHAALSYSFVRAMQGPAMAMMLRGVAIQSQVRQDETERYLQIRTSAQELLDRFADAVWGPETYTERTKTRELHTPIGARGQPLTPRWRTVVVERRAVRPLGLNPNSPTQVLAFFNTALGCPVIHEVRKTPEGSIRTPSANDKALTKWAKARSKGPGINIRDHTVAPVNLAAPFVSLILTIRDADKMLGVLRTPLDPDGRMRCSYNVVGTETGRWSSSKNVFGRGNNLQNITPTMRRMFCADDGWWFVSTDLEQAESWIVAGLVWEVTGDTTYWEAIASGDLHTQVCRMVWPELPWTDDPKANRTIADRRCHDLPPTGVGFSYRDVAKRLGHGSNYNGSAYGIAAAVGVPAYVVEEFQRRYFVAFPALRQWHAWVKAQIATHQYLDTPLGRRRWFFGRPTEDATVREAIAYSPQSTVAELLNLIMYRVWERSLLYTGMPTDPPEALPIQLLLQNHDAFVFQVPTILNLPSVIEAINLEFQSAPITFVRGGEQRTITSPGEFVTGFNWAYKDNDPDQANWKFKDGNPDGLVKWKGSDDRRRQQTAATRPSDWLSGTRARVFPR